MARKSPTSSVVKRLFAKSGNRCAYDDCINTLVDDDGNVLGEICHIEAASKNGPRYNPHSDDEHRRSYDNLILLCERHHKIVDKNPEIYTSQKLRHFKSSHQTKNSTSGFKVTEKVITDAINKIQDYIIQTNTYSGNGNQYVINAKNVNLDTSGVETKNKDTKTNGSSLKDRFDLIATFLGIISVFLTITSRSAGILPSLNPYILHLLILSTVLIMILFGYIGWSKSKGNRIINRPRSKQISKIAFFSIPILSFIIWFSFIKLNSDEIKERDKLIELGNSYYDKIHLKRGALEPYRQALKIDPSQLEIIQRVKKLEE